MPKTTELFTSTVAYYRTLELLDAAQLAAYNASHGTFYTKANLAADTAELEVQHG